MSLFKPKRYERPGGSGVGPRKHRWLPRMLRGKPWRRLQREIYQRVYTYPHRNMLAICQPKSGSTWLSNMMQDIPGVFRWFPESMNRQTLKEPGFHDLLLEEMRRVPAGYTVSKTHTSPTPRNLEVLRALGRRYVVLIRDPRDQIVSWAYFVKNREENAFYEDTKGMSTEEAVTFFIERLYDEMLAWAVDWKSAIEEPHSDLGLLVRYEDMKADGFGVMKRVFAHYSVGLSDEKVRAIVDANTFEKTTGRAAGHGDAKSFFRKGVSGDWANHFTDAQRRRVEELDRGRMAVLGYLESDNR